MAMGTAMLCDPFDLGPEAAILTRLAGLSPGVSATVVDLAYDLYLFFAWRILSHVWDQQEGAIWYTDLGLDARDFRESVLVLDIRGTWAPAS